MASETLPLWGDVWSDVAFGEGAEMENTQIYFNFYFTKNKCKNGTINYMRQKPKICTLDNL